MSSFGVIAVGVVGSLVGGAVFAAVVAAIGIGVYVELARMTPQIGLGYRLGWPGFVVIVAAASLALISREPWAIAMMAAITVLLPTLMIFRMPIEADSFAAWVATVAAGIYIAVPVFAAISLRQTAGALETGWADRLGDAFSMGDVSTSLGMAWTMVAILATWLADTFALFVGRAIGRTPLIPHISPKKTLEGAIGGFLGGVVAVVLLKLLLGVPDLSIPLAIAVGVLLTAVGICGDLMESFIKRCAGVKDSGALIPGHGGVFDRVDALLPTFLVTWAIVQSIAA
jgi:phosphatidate cytidylyltransferase